MGRLASPARPASHRDASSSDQVTSRARAETVPVVAPKNVVPVTMEPSLGGPSQ